MKVAGVGIDVVDIVRIRPHVKRKSSKFLRDTFTEQERAYCGKYKDRAPHFAGMFAAKEAVVKACGGKVFIRGVEVRHRGSGQPEIWISNHRTKIHISISHSDTIACAIAIKS